MDLTFGLPGWYLLPCALVAAGATWWLYRTTIPDLPGAQRFLLGSLRFLALFLIAFLLLEPILQRLQKRTVEPVVGLLVDQSESMLLADSLLGEAGVPIQQALRQLGNETDALNVRTFGFGASVSEIPSADSLRFTHSRTDIAQALDRLRAELVNEPLAAVILVSDGLYNTGANPLHLADRYPVPVFSVAHGDSSARRDVRIDGVITNNLSYAGSEVPVQVRIRNDGVPEAPLQVTLFDGSAVIGTITTALPSPGSERMVEMAFEAAEPGLRALRVVITRYEDEVTWRNNETRFDVQVLDQKKSIFLVAGAPSPDVAAVRRLLEADDTASLTVRTQKPDGSWQEGAFPSDFDDIDLIVAVGFPGASTPPADAARVTDAVASGTPMLFLMDRSLSLPGLQRSFASLLPLQPRSIRPGYMDGTIQQTPAAASHAVFDIDERRDGSLWRRLPPISLSETQWEAAAGATVLATSEIRGVALPDPVLAVMRRGQVKTAALTAHGIWRWTLVPEDLESEAARFTQLMGNLVQWLYAADDDRLVRVAPVESSFAEGEPVLFRGEVYDEALRPLPDASLTLRLTSPGGQVFPYEMQPQGNGRFLMDLGALPAGSYTFEAVAAFEDAEVGTDRGAFSIGRRTLEYRQTRADFDLMRQLAARSGGSMVTSSDVSGLADAIRSASTFQPTDASSISQIRLWQRFPFLALILLFLTVEWFFRKRWGMV